MAKANVELKNGTKVQVEGTAEEIKKIVDFLKFERHEPATIAESKKFVKRTEATTSKPSISTHLRGLKEDKFFNSPKSLAEIKTVLEEQGYFYPVTTLSGVVLDLVKRRELGRIKKNKTWGYVKR